MPKRPQLLVQRGRALRDAQSDAEATLWHALRNRQIEGRKFRRQHAIGPYIVDFACLEEGLVVELDGGQHAESVTADAKRTTHLQAQGLRVLRFWNNEVLGNLEGVLEVVRAALLNAGPSPQPSPQRGEGERHGDGEVAEVSPQPSPQRGEGEIPPASHGGKNTAQPTSSSPLPRGERVRVRGQQ